MITAFDPTRADLYRIADVRPDRLFISRVEQKTFVEVNEGGTEASRGHRERFSGAIVFLGQINAVGS